ncbi:hypothetical protein [Hydrocoleum sp. CS-953]|uniref:hypothetical protein n=1 Tax=Microcoleaceae TaxID=1892252 RepID=UPI000B9C45EC|nr:hypothetical protein [Hydrocoleum sp. CS-953]OZH53067.1 hypothetical protein AFK68_20200 [Hydrocoleum sp. CS-953]
MNDSANKFLLSMLLAIKESDTPLSSEEKENLYIAGQQLSLDPTAWEEDIQPSLMEIINNNPSLNTVFQNINSKLEKIDEMPQDLILNTEDVKTVTPTEENQPLERPIPDVDMSDLESNEITNAAIQIISSPEPSETVQKISKFDKLMNLIGQD